MKTGLRHFTVLLYPAVWKTKADFLENGYGMETDVKSKGGYISLSAAANHGHLPIVELLKHGADEITRDKQGNNVLMTAVDIGHVDIVCWLMQNIKHTDMKPNAEYVTLLT